MGRGDWIKVAEQVGHGVNNKQCYKRWFSYVDPALAECKHGAWTKEEVKNRHRVLLCHLSIQCW